jgi:hypothetical protein
MSTKHSWTCGALDPLFQHAFESSDARRQWFLTLQGLWMTCTLTGRFLPFDRLARGALEMTPDRSGVSARHDGEGRTRLLRPGLLPNTYQPSPGQERRSFPSGRRVKETRDRQQERSNQRGPLQSRLRFQRGRDLDTEVAPNTY